MSEVILGYDAHCSICSRVGERVEAEVKGGVKVLPLQSTLMREYRARAFGVDAPWAPTLVEVDGESVRAWVGWRMGPRLARTIGVARSAQVLSIVGQEQPALSGARTIASPRRRSVLKYSAGAVLGALTLAGLSPQALAKSSSVSPGTLLLGANITEPHLSLLGGIDARVAFAGEKDIASLRTRAHAASLRKYEKVSDVDKGGSGTFVLGHVRDGANGQVERSISLMDLSESKIYHAYRIELNDSVVESGATVYLVDQGAGTARPLRTSVNGALPERVSKAALQESVVAGVDPCGGCTGPGGPGDASKKSGTMCDEEIDVGCALGIAGCAGCVAACAGSGGAGCIWCLVTSCGGTIASSGCCKGDGSSHHVCEKCSAPL